MERCNAGDSVTGSGGPARRLCADGVPFRPEGSCYLSVMYAVDPRRRWLAPSRALLTPLVAIVLALVVPVLWPSDAGAHAELVRAEPPVDGLVLTSPSQISLFFSEEIAPDASLGILDDEGRAFGTSPLPVGANGDARQLIVNVASLDPGTYTVTWNATSRVDGHQLSGTYAFRVGGGLPPGVATVEGENPAPWAVLTRWLTFLGASTVAGAFLSRLAIVPDAGETRRWGRRRSRLILGGAAVALLSTLAEPLLQGLFHDRGEALSIAESIRGLPGGWWWRPAMIAPLTALGIAIVYPLRGNLPRLLAVAGLVLSMASLLGLALTSHAAGRESWREIAIVSNVLHQWSSALWIGGLIALGAYLTAGDGSTTRAGVERSPIARFSSLALILFGVAVVTGTVNTGFVFPFVSEIRREGLGVSIFEPLWTSRYGVALLVKLLVLVVPFILAVWHRAAIGRVASAAAGTARTFPARFGTTLRLEAILVALVILGGSTIALSAPPPSEEPEREYATLVAPARTAAGEEPMLAHLTVAPARQGDNTLTVRLTDWDGAAIRDVTAPSVTLELLSLDHGVSKPGIALESSGADAATWSTAGLDLSLQGWWQVTAHVSRPRQDEASAAFFVLLPDPNTNGFANGPKPPSSDDAEALFQQALATMTSWRSVRWIEYLGSGDDVLVLAEFGVVDGGGHQPNAYEVNLRYSGGFAPSPNGDPPQPPTYDTRRSITVGERSWLSTGENDEWLEQPPGRFDLPSQWGEIYEGSQNFRLGTTQSINGEEAQIITFYSPGRVGQSEAWYAWWIGVETGNVLQVTMIANQHYMMWQYTEQNGDLSIAAPVNP